VKKSELYTRYQNFNKDIVEISQSEFFEHLTPNTPKDTVEYMKDGSTECITVRTDGWDYLQVSSHWNVGWHGDIDGDVFYCKIQTTTKAEREEIRKMFYEDIF